MIREIEVLLYVKRLISFIIKRNSIIDFDLERKIKYVLRKDYGTIFIFNK